MATVVSETTEIDTLADLLDRLGNIPLERIRFRPYPGTATEQDVLDCKARLGRVCELVDGVLVEKAMGYYEDRLGLLLGHFLEDFLEIHDLGICLGAQGLIRVEPGQVRIHDVSFFSWDQFPDRKLPAGGILERIPDLAVEILSPSNTEAEMTRKRQECFAGGTRLFWQVYPDSRRVRVYTAVEQFAQLDDSQSLRGEPVLPGFSLSIQRWFERAGQRAES